MDSYHVTVDGQTNVQAKERKAKSQEADILWIFRFYPTRLFSPWEIKQRLDAIIHNGSLSNHLITSTRRAITNLTVKGNLIKCSTLKEGPHGHLCHTWRLRTSSDGPVTLKEKEEATRDAEVDPDRTQTTESISTHTDIPRRLEAKIKAIEREVRYRKHVYPRLVSTERMTEDFAARQIEIMEEILQDYRTYVAEQVELF